MSVFDIVKNFENGVSDVNARNAFLQNIDVWSNAACVGYVLEAMRQAGTPTAERERIVKHLEALFGSLSVDEAEALAQQKGAF